MNAPATMHIDACDHNAATTLLDSKFPLQQGSHSEVASYVVYFNHLIAITTDGRTTGLETTSHFISSDGSLYGLSAFVLGDGYTLVNIGMRRCANADDTLHPCIEEMSVVTISLAS